MPDVAQPPPTARPLREQMQPLPRGRHHLAPEVVKQTQTERLLVAMIREVAARGYAETTVADVIRTAGVSRKTFYEIFSDKEACFLAAFEELSAGITASVTERLQGVVGPQARIEASFTALCAELAAAPEYAEVLLIRAAEAGPRARRRRNLMNQVGVDLVMTLVEQGTHEGTPRPPGANESVARAIVGATEALLIHRIGTHGAARLPDLVPTLTQIATALMLTPIEGPGGPSGTATSGTASGN